tara:strand:- start:905 stop:1750 length:846 start_codon:yes stop_codon:yes gene_type:complete
MYDFFLKNYFDYIIENSIDYLIYLIPGTELKIKLDWYGEKRAEAFNSLKTKSFISDIEERDVYYTHMIIWDKANFELVGGQRFLFNQKGSIEKKDYSYLEEYHQGTYEKLKNYSFCEIGRTFIMPKFQHKKVLKELIRGFVRVPELRKMNLGIGLISFNNKVLNNKSVNTFLKYLENRKTNILDLPKGKYNFNKYLSNLSLGFNYSFEYQNLNKIEKEINKLDNNFKLPPVLKPYIKFCGLKYEGYSIAKDYNGIIQLLFSGRYEEIENYPAKKLKPYKTL